MNKFVRLRIARLLQSTFFRDVAKLSFGTIGGRLIAFAALPLVTRLYTPEDFALLAVYLALVSTIAVAACFRFEIAIPLAENDEDAAHLLVLALLAASAVSLGLTTVALTASEAVADALGVPDIARFFWLVPLGVLMTASYPAFQYWATRARRFGSIARTRVSQAVIGAGTMLGFGWAGIVPLGLLLGNMLNHGAGGLRLAVEAIVRDRNQLRAVNKASLSSTMRHYWRYPIYSTPAALANMAAVQVPVLLIAAYAGDEAGSLFLAMQVMNMPMVLLASSVSQVYMSRAVEELRSGRLAEFTLGIMRRLLFVGFGPIILLGALSPTIFQWVFGPDWERAGEIAAWTAPWIATQLVANPISAVMLLRNRHLLFLFIQFSLLIFRTSFTFVAIKWEPAFGVLAFGISGFMASILTACTYASVAGVTYKHLRQTVAKTSAGSALLILLILLIYVYAIKGVIKWRF